MVGRIPMVALGPAKVETISNGILPNAKDNGQDEDSSFIQVEEARENSNEWNKADFKKQIDEGISADSGSNFHLLKPGHVKQGTIRKLKQPFNYGSNTGSREDLTNEGESKLIPECMGKIDPEAAHSVKSLSKLYEDGWDILMDTRRWNGITVHKDGQVIRLPERNGLYTWMPEEQPKYGEPAWIDELGSKLLFEQFTRVKTLKELIYLNDGIDPHTEYLLERETEIYEMMKGDLENGNLSVWVEDMIYRARFGKNQALQEHFVGGKVTRANIQKVLTRLYDKIPDKYDGGINQHFLHAKINYDIVARLRRRNRYAADVNLLPPPSASIPLEDPFDIIDEFQPEGEAKHEQNTSNGDRG